MMGATLFVNQKSLFHPNFILLFSLIVVAELTNWLRMDKTN